MRKNEAAWNEKEKRWKINVQRDGERKTFNSSVKGKKGKIAAEQKADKWLENKMLSDNTRCEILLDNFLERLKLTAGTSHYRTTEIYTRLYIKPRIGAKKIGTITQNDLQSIIDFAYGKPDNGKTKLSDKTLRNIRATVMAFIKYCRGEKCTQFHPDTLNIPASAKKSKKTILGIEDIVTLFTVDTTIFNGERVRDNFVHVYRWAVVTGMRPGEICGLMNADIDGTKVEIARSINGINEVTEGKNDNAQRVYALDSHAIKILEDQRAMLIELMQISPYVFPGADCNHLKQSHYYEAWKRYCRANGITTGTTPYELRHTFVSVNTNMPDALKKLFMGHSENMDTHGIYGHEKAGDMELAASYVNKAYKKILGW